MVGESFFSFLMLETRKKMFAARKGKSKQVKETNPIEASLLIKAAKLCLNESPSLQIV
jgi:hypothetical protein